MPILGGGNVENEVTKLKKQYNDVLIRHYKGKKYLDDDSILIENREKWVPEFTNILHELSRILKAIEDSGIKYTDSEILGGFDVEKRKKAG